MLTRCPILVWYIVQYCQARLTRRASIDPSDIEALEENPTPAKDIQVDATLEAARPEDKRKAQEWAGIKQDPNSNLFVFVGRWSKQKGMSLQCQL